MRTNQPRFPRKRANANGRTCSSYVRPFQYAQLLISRRESSAHHRSAAVTAVGFARPLVAVSHGEASVWRSDHALPYRCCDQPAWGAVQEQLPLAQPPLVRWGFRSTTAAASNPLRPPLGRAQGGPELGQAQGRRALGQAQGGPLLWLVGVALAPLASFLCAFGIPGLLRSVELPGPLEAVGQVGPLRGRGGCAGAASAAPHWAGLLGRSGAWRSLRLMRVRCSVAPLLVWAVAHWDLWADSPG